MWRGNGKCADMPHSPQSETNFNMKYNLNGEQQFYELAKTCEGEFLVTVEQILGRDKHRPLPDIRRIVTCAMYYIHKVPKKEVARLLHRTESMIEKTINQQPSRMENDLGYRYNYNLISDKLQPELKFI